MISETLPIYKDVITLIETLISYCADIPRFARFTLAQKVINNCTDLLDLIQLTNSVPNREKRTEYMEEFICKFTTIKTIIRILHETNNLSHKQAGNIALITESIGKQATAWKKSFEQ